MLRERRSVLRVRVESGKSLITFKGPVQPAGDQDCATSSRRWSATDRWC